MANSLTSRGLALRIARVAAVSCAFAVGACSADDVELNGKIFEAAGLNTKSKSVEPKLAARAPLVMPPNPERVPEPGLPPEANAALAEVNDPDRAQRTSQAELERQQAEYCKVHYELAKAHGDNDADQATGPLGPCRGSVLTALKKWQGDDEPVAEDEQ